MPDKSFYKNGLNFQCVRCSNCCRHESGYVFLSQTDLLRIVRYLKISQEEFLTTYCRSVDNGHEVKISLLEKENNDCIFWNNEQDGCSIYPARPLQCQSYPFWPSLLNASAWFSEGQVCPGIGQGKCHQASEIDHMIKQRENEPFIILQKHEESDGET